MTCFGQAYSDNWINPPFRLNTEICPPWKGPESGHVLAPFVCVQFQSGGEEISVSNNSSPASGNTACIQAFEVSYVDGFSVRVTIQDQAGAQVAVFMDTLFKNWGTASDGTPDRSKMTFQYGWVKAGCMSSPQSASSPMYYAVVRNLEMEIVDGKVICEVIGTDLGEVCFDGSSRLIVGGEGQQSEYFYNALHKLLVDNPDYPNIKDFDFKAADGSDITFWKMGADDDPKKGPKDCWRANGQDKLTAARRWASHVLSTNHRAFVMRYDPQKEEGMIHFVEDNKPKGNESPEYFNNFCIGTYLVNGSKYSPVLEFRPKMRWQWSTLTGVGGGLSTLKLSPITDVGGNPSMTSPGRIEISGLDRIKQPGAGHDLTLAENPFYNNIAGEKGQDINRHVKDEHQRSGGASLLSDIIEADLVLIGDPSIGPWCPKVTIQSDQHSVVRAGVGYFVTIIYVNPIYISGYPVSDWLAQPTVNEVLTNNAWYITNVMHRITVGNYTTTLRVTLAAPGIHLPPDANLGGSSSGANVS